MYRAAMGVYNSYDGWKGKKIAIVVGGGNNGGDGYALAGILKKDGIDSVIIKVAEKMSEDGKYYSGIASELGVRSEVFTPETDLSGYDVIVDCILGTGFSGEVRGMAKTAIDAINRSGAYVICVDINSGMNGDTGEAVTAGTVSATPYLTAQTILPSSISKDYISQVDIAAITITESDNAAGGKTVTIGAVDPNAA